MRSILNRTSRMNLLLVALGVGLAALAWAGWVAEPPGPARAGEASALYLPMIAGNTPFPTVFGVEMTKIDANHGMDLMSEAGNYWIRRNNIVLWSDLQPTEGGPINWSLLSGLEDELRLAAARRMPVVLLVRSTPDWAQLIPGKYCGPIKPDALDEFAAFMAELVSRYSAAPYYVNYYEIWNEPDVDPSVVPDDTLFGCWGDPNDPYFGGEYYGDMLSVVYPAIKAASPTAQVVFGGLLMDCEPANCDQLPGGGTTSDFLAGALYRHGANDGGNYFDGISFHAYDYRSIYGPLGAYGNLNWDSVYNTTGPVSIAKARFLRQVLANNGVSGKFLMNTESALICQPDNAGVGCESDDNSLYEQSKAHYLAQAFAAAVAEDFRANFWFTAVTGWRHSELINGDLTPRPAYTAFKVAREQISNAVFSREITEYANIMGYELTRPGHRLWVIWSLDGNPQPITLPGTPVSITDALGNAIPPGSSVAPTSRPLYLDWGP